MKKSKLTPISAKKKLIQYYGFKNSDFYDNILICKDNIDISAVDVLEEIQLTFKEQYEELWTK